MVFLIEISGSALSCFLLRFWKLRGIDVVILQGLHFLGNLILCFIVLKCKQECSCLLRN